MHSKELLTAIHLLNKQNLNTNKPYTVLCSRLILADKHKKDKQIQTLINKINQQFALTDKEQQEYKKNPLLFIGKSSIIGIHNQHRETYRVIRAEHFNEYTKLCKGLEKLGLTLHIVKDYYLQVIFS